MPPARPPERPPTGPQPRPSAPWDQGIFETDPGLRYREPGPGMPGYRGGTPTRGADPYAPDPYANDLHNGDAYPTNGYPNNGYPAGGYPNNGPASVWDGDLYADEASYGDPYGWNGTGWDGRQ